MTHHRKNEHLKNEAGGGKNLKGEELHRRHIHLNWIPSKALS